MQGFHILETGGREKFLKKKKDKKAKVEQDNKQLALVLLIQKNIQRFLEIKKANEIEQSKIEIQNQPQQNQNLWKYWLLTPYHVRIYGRGYYLMRFWTSYSNGLNQVQSVSNSLISRMTKLTIEFLPQVLGNDPKQGAKICETIFALIKNSKYIISKNQANSVIHALNLSKQSSITDLKKNFLDILFSTNNTKPLGMELFTQESHFIEYLILKRKDILSNKSNFVQIEQMVFKCYPILLEKSSPKIQIQQQEGSQWLWKNYEQLTKLYTSILRWLQASKRPPQVMLIWIAFLNNITLKIKGKTLQQINTKNKINPKIFQSQQAYQEYIEQKEEYFSFKEILTGGDYEKTKTLMKNIIQVIMMQKSIQIPAKQIVYEEAMQYVNDVLMAFGQIDLLPMNEAVNFFLDNVNQTTIYGLGKESCFSFGKNNLSHQNKILLALNIALKSAVQTPDLYFTKFYQEKTQQDKLKKLIKQCLLKTLKHTMFLPHSTPTIKLISRTTISLLQNFYNKIFRTNIISPEVFQNSSFASKLKTYEFRKNVKDEVSLFLNQFPYVFPLPERAQKFRQLLREDRGRSNYNRHHFLQMESDEQEEMEWDRNVKIRRNYEFVDAFDQLKKKDLRSGFRITFINQLGFEEKGFDAGGLTKEFLNRVLKDALNPNYGMFIENSVHELLPHPIKAELSQGIETEYYEFIGKLIGLAICLNITLGYKFSGTFLNAIVGKKNTFDDLKTIDPDLYKSLVYIKDMQEDASELGLTFMYTDNIRKKNIQLLPNGHLIHVTNQNKRLYISLLTAYKVNRLLEHQTRFIRKGLTSTIHKEWLFMFNYEELNYLISGQGVIDVEDLRKYSKVIGFDEKQTKTIRYFWEVVRQFSEQQKSKLLMFVTACPRPSFLGFKELSPPFTIACMKDKQNFLPISHTCSNVLELPDYNDKQLLRKKLTTAIESNAGFEFG